MSAITGSTAAPAVQMNNVNNSTAASVAKPTANLNAGKSTMSSAATADSSEVKAPAWFKANIGVSGLTRMWEGRGFYTSKADKAAAQAAASKATTDAAAAAAAATAAAATTTKAPAAKPATLVSRATAAVSQAASSVKSAMSSTISFVAKAISQTIGFMGKLIAFPFVAAYKAVQWTANGISSVLSSMFNAVFGKKAPAPAAGPTATVVTDKKAV